MPEFAVETPENDADDAELSEKNRLKPLWHAICQICQMQLSKLSNAFVIFDKSI